MNRPKEKLFGLIGFPLGHSFSKQFFSEKFLQENIQNCRYELFPLPDIANFPKLVADQTGLAGLNVTIPWKEKIIPYLDGLSPEAAQIGAVNVIQIKDGKLIGHNSDAFGFEISLTDFLSENLPVNTPGSLILGTGGAAKAVAFVLKKMGIAFRFVSRKKDTITLTYNELDEKILNTHRLIINTTPLGTHPYTEACPPLPYHLLTPANLLFDLVYNPPKPLFLIKGQSQGCPTCNGLKMLYLQAEQAWDIWNENG